MRPIAALSSVFALSLLAGGCGSSEDPPPGAEVLSFKLTDEGCEPHDAQAPAGPIAFEAKGDSASATELEVLDGDTVLAEKENITEGLEAGFTLTLEQGKYTLHCGDGLKDGTLTVTGSKG